MKVTRRKFLGVASAGMASVGPASATPRMTDEILIAAQRAADPPLMVNTFPGGLTYIDPDFIRQYERQIHDVFRKQGSFLRGTVR